MTEDWASRRWRANEYTKFEKGWQPRMRGPRFVQPEVLDNGLCSACLELERECACKMEWEKKREAERKKYANSMRVA